MNLVRSSRRLIDHCSECDHLSIYHSRFFLVKKDEAHHSMIQTVKGEGSCSKCYCKTFKSKEIKTQALGVQIALIVLCLVFFGVLMPIFYAVTNPINVWSTHNYPSGVYDANTFTFMNSWWLWWPIIGILFPLIIYGLLQAQRRRPDEPL